MPHLFIDIAVALGFSEVGEDQDLAVKKVLKAIKDLKNRVGIPKSLCRSGTSGFFKLVWYVS